MIPSFMVHDFFLNIAAISRQICHDGEKLTKSIWLDLNAENMEKVWLIGGEHALCDALAKDANYPERTLVGAALRLQARAHETSAPSTTPPPPANECKMLGEAYFQPQEFDAVHEVIRPKKIAKISFEIYCSADDFEVFWDFCGATKPPATVVLKVAENANTPSSGTGLRYMAPFASTTSVWEVSEKNEYLLGIVGFRLHS